MMPDLDSQNHVRLTRTDAITRFSQQVMPRIRLGEAIRMREHGIGIDYPYRTEEWNEYLSDLEHAGLITQEQARTWAPPAQCKSPLESGKKEAWT